MVANKCCYTCEYFRHIEISGRIVDGRNVCGCRVNGILIGMGHRADLSPLSYNCKLWRAKDDRE